MSDVGGDFDAAMVLRARQVIQGQMIRTNMTLQTNRLEDSHLIHLNDIEIAKTYKNEWTEIECTQHRNKDRLIDSKGGDKITEIYKMKQAVSRDEMDSVDEKPNQKLETNERIMNGKISRGIEQRIQFRNSEQALKSSKTFEKNCQRRDAVYSAIQLASSDTKMKLLNRMNKWVGEINACGDGIAIRNDNGGRGDWNEGENTIILQRKGEEKRKSFIKEDLKEDQMKRDKGGLFLDRESERGEGFCRISKEGNGKMYSMSTWDKSLKRCYEMASKTSPLCGISSMASSAFSTFSKLLQNVVVISVLMTVLLSFANLPVICAENVAFDQEIDPVFLEPVPNVTVAVGRDASLTCAVDHLGLHKVAWIHLDRQMIVSIHNHVITRQPRFTVTHDSHKTWTLHVTKVEEKDRGHYMCQVNTKPMISQTGYLQVVVPPNIVDKVSSKSNIVVREKENVTLVCQGEGFPVPKIKWRREDGRPIETLDGKKVRQHDGPKLALRHVSREYMGAYLCIATNGVPPSVSKRITLDVEFAPQMNVPNQLVGSPVDTEVKLECFVEAHPKAITYWEFNDSMVMNSSRVTTHTSEDRYKIHMTLIIRDLSDRDFGMYKCISKNSISETDGSITLNKVLKPTSPPQIMLHGYEDEVNQYKNRGRQEQHMKQLEEMRRKQREEEQRKKQQREDAIRAKEMERQRLEHDFDRGQRNEQATRVTSTQNGCDALSVKKASLMHCFCLSAVYILSHFYHI